MHCHYHPDAPVERECRVCQQLVCSDCIIKVDGVVVCRTCLAETVTLRDEGLAPAISVKGAGVSTKLPPSPAAKQDALHVLREKTEALDAQKSGVLTVLFSVLPGLGHLYLGMQKRSVSLMALFFAIIFLSTVVPSSLGFPVGLAIPILWFYSQFDALKYRAMINDGESFDDEPLIPQLAQVKMSWVGYLLFGYGVLAIINNVINYAELDASTRYLIKDLLSAGVLIAIGLWVLSGKAGSLLTRRRDEEDHRHA